jgi:Icc-related predicted phosphoesterase
MKFRVISDVHLDVTPAPLVLESLPKMEEDKSSILLLAGDVGGWDELEAEGDNLDLFFDTVSVQFRLVVYVIGNHEAYHGCIDTIADKIREYIGKYSNVVLLDNDVMVVDDIAIIGSTLWSSFKDGDFFEMNDARLNMNDYHVIRKIREEDGEHTRKLQPYDTYELHKEAVTYLKWAMEQYRAKDKKLVVVTHHAPSFESVSERFRSHTCNGAFASSLESLMDQYEPVLWVHGHMHNHKDYMIYDTRIICNPFGYTIREREEFDLNCVIEI